MPVNCLKLFADAWKSTKNSIGLHRQRQHPSTETSEKVQHSEPLQTSSAALSAALSHDENLIDTPSLPLDQRHESQHDEIRLSVGHMGPPQAEDYDDCGRPLHATLQRSDDGNAAKTRMSEEEYADYRTKDQHTNNDIRRKLKEVHRHRARLRGEKIRLDEQARIVQYKLEDLNETIAALQIKLDSDLSDVQHPDAARQTDPVQAVQRASAKFSTATDTLDHLQQRVWKLEGRLDEAETDLIRLMGEEQPSDVESNSTGLSETDSEVFSPEVPYPMVSIVEREYQDDIVSINELVQMPVYQESFRLSETSEHVQAEELIPQDLESDFLDLAISDRTVQLAGEQFFSGDDETSTILPEEYDLSKDNIFVRMKRRRDLASIPELWPLHKSSETTNFDHFYNPEISSLGLGHMVSFWILQYFACSWLEFSRYIFLAGMDPALDQVVVSFGYFQLSSLIYANWFCDENLARPPPALSVYPSISHATDDVPQQYQQIFIPESDDGMKEIEYIQLQVSSTLTALMDIRPVSNVAQPVYTDRSTEAHSMSSRSSKAPSQIFEHPRRMDTLLTEWADSGERIPAPCNNTNNSS